MSRTTTERDEGTYLAVTGSRYDQRDLGEMRGFDPHPEDMLPPAAHLLPGEGVTDLLGALDAAVKAARHANACEDCGTRCSAYCDERLCSTNGPAVGARCGDHIVCESCVDDGWDQDCRDCALDIAERVKERAIEREIVAARDARAGA